MTLISNQNPAFVLGMGDMGLAIIRSLARQDVQVVGFDSDPLKAGFLSRYCRGVQCPNPDLSSQSENEVLDLLFQEAKRYHENPVILPASRVYADFLSRNEGKLKRSFCFTLPSAGVVNVNSDANAANEATDTFEVSVYLDRTGNCVSSFVMQHLRQYPPHSGVATLGQSIWKPELVETAVELARKNQIFGFSHFQFRLHDGKIECTEFDPFHFQQMALADECGIDFPILQYQESTEQTLVQASHYETGIKWLDPLPDFQSFITTAGAGPLSLVRWGSTIRGTRVLSIISADDPLPGLSATGFGSKIIHAARVWMKQTLKSTSRSQRNRRS